MTAGLAYQPADASPNSTSTVNKFGLDRFFMLPRPWQVKALQKCGGSGHETCQILAMALSPMPDNADLSKAQQWQAVQHLQQLAQQIEEISTRLREVPRASIELLSLDAAALRRRAKAIAAKEEARHRRLRSRGDAGITEGQRDPKAIRRRLRRAANSAFVHVCGILQFAGGPEEGHEPNYADDLILERWRDTKAQTCAWMHDQHVTVSSGERVPLIDIVTRHSESTRAMRYAFALALQERGRRDGRIAMFISTTLPPQWHANPSTGQCLYDARLSPLAAHQEQQRRWHRAGCSWRGHGSMPYGIRTNEAHTDGTPHLHAVLWVTEDERARVVATLDRQWPATTPLEQAARDMGDYTRGPSLTIREWDEDGQGSVASYVLDGVLKVADFSDDANAPDDDVQRSEAWASHIGLRRVSLVGLAKGTVGKWRAAYRAMLSRDTTCPRGRAVSHAMRRKHWAAALVLLGAVPTPSGVPYALAEHGRRSLLTKMRRRANSSTATQVEKINAGQEVARLVSMGRFCPVQRFVTNYRNVPTRHGDTKRVIAGYHHAKTGRLSFRVPGKTRPSGNPLKGGIISFAASYPRIGWPTRLEQRSRAIGASQWSRSDPPNPGWATPKYLQKTTKAQTTFGRVTPPDRRPSRTPPPTLDH